MLRLTRRRLIELGVTTGAALALELWLPYRALRALAPGAADPFRPNAWLAIGSDDIVTVTVAKSEMGQGVWTGLPMLVAEELGADWSRVRIHRADGDADNDYQNTGGSSSVPDSWDILRRAGAVAREMLRSAAARRWGVPPADCQVAEGVVRHQATGRSARFGELVTDATQLPVPDATTVPLKPREEYRLIGRPLGRLDTPAKISGEATFGSDVRVPGMRFAVVARCPYLGGRLLHHTAHRALAVPGVQGVVEMRPMGPPLHLRGGVAVVADTTWSALEGRKALEIEWDHGPHTGVTNASIMRSFRDAAAREAKLVREAGTVAGASFEATYEYPFLAHAAMEPLNCTARVAEGRAEVWAPTQFPPNAISVVAQLLSIPPEKVTLHVPFIGGGFGRRINEDFVAECIQLARQLDHPVQILWTRDDDLQHDFYRQAGAQRLEAALDSRGYPTALLHRIAGPSTNAFYTPGHPRPEGQELWGTQFPYAIPNHRLEYAQVDTPVPIGWWRAVSVAQNQFCLEAFISELAARAGVDPLEFRKEMLSHHPRLLALLDAVAELSEWRTPAPAGRARGVAIAWGDGTFVAEVVELSLTARGEPRVHRVSCAVDCGLVINPNLVAAQAEGSIVWGLTGALLNEITVADGMPQQRHFGDYPILRMPDMPEIRIRLMEGGTAPSGIGEPCVVPVAPALAAAVSRLRGTAVRSLPIRAAS
jgi:isoquinoline 1-oxidoreductase subunit beta